jgi:hypothetical protein
MSNDVSLSTEDEIPEVVIAMVRRCGRGTRTKACYLSGRLSGEIRRLAAKQNRSEANLVRDILRNELRRLGLLPNKSFSSIDAAAGHVDEGLTNAAQA